MSSRLLRTVIPIIALILGWIVRGDSSTSCTCRDLTDEDFYQASSNDLGMWVTGAQIQTDDDELLRQLRQAGYRVYVPLCPWSQHRVTAEGKQLGLDPESMEPWALETVIRVRAQ